jgi:hypothetical protein
MASMLRTIEQSERRSDCSAPGNWTKEQFRRLMTKHHIRERGGDCEYEAAKRVIEELARDSHEYDLLVQWATNYTGV